MKQLIVPVALVAGMLSACGGGGGGGNSSSGSSPGAGGVNAGAIVTPPVAPPTTVFQKPRQSVNDVESYLITPLTSGDTLEAPYWTTSVTTKLNADNSYTQATIGNATTDRSYTDYRADGAQLSAGEICRYTSPFIRIPDSLTLGQSWDNSAIQTCNDSPPSRSEDNSKGSVVAAETLSVLAGTFNAVKTVHTESFKSTFGTDVRDLTCWRDTATGLELKCSGSSTFTPLRAGAAVVKRSFSWELGGFASAATGRQKANIERYAGKWQVWFTGTSNGICDVRIDTAGAISGTCSNNYGLDFGIAGSVAANGTAKFNLTEGGASGTGFSGNFESPLKIAGTWSAGTDNGTWYMLHL